MILRRLAKSIRRQDWTAVAIEFVIVVAGIFVGLQVTDWNEQRQLREREAYVIAQLASDIRAIEQQAQELAELYRGKVASADRIVAFIASRLESPEDEAALLDDFSNVMFRRHGLDRHVRAEPHAGVVDRIQPVLGLAPGIGDLFGWFRALGPGQLAEQQAGLGRVFDQALLGLCAEQLTFEELDLLMQFINAGGEFLVVFL